MSETFVVPEFKEWPKMERYKQLRCTVTEKIDGTNASIYIPPNPDHPVIAGKRTSWLMNGAKNFGFEVWVYENAKALRRLGPGTHFGEWYGAGIQRRYGLDHKRFALFDAGRWTLGPETGKGGLPEGLPAELGVVPILYRGAFDPRSVDATIAKLYREGSVAVPGWSTPEGVVVQVQGCPAWKLTDNGDAKKGRQHHIEAVIGTLAIEKHLDNHNGDYTVVSGRTMGGYRLHETVNTLDDEEIRAAAYRVADAIVRDDAKTLNTRKVQP